MLIDSNNIMIKFCTKRIINVKLAVQLSLQDQNIAPFVIYAFLNSIIIAFGIFYLIKQDKTVCWLKKL